MVGYFRVSDVFIKDDGFIFSVGIYGAEYSVIINIRIIQRPVIDRQPGAAGRVQKRFFGAVNIDPI